MTTVQYEIKTADLEAAYAGSWYTIIGAGGDPQEWVKGYEGMLKEADIGTPAAWYSALGSAVNEYVGPANPQDAFKDDLTFLLFPLDGLVVGKLAMFKLQMEDRWFDDIIQNARPEETS